MKKYFVYITTNKNRTTLYTGITNNLERRMIEHVENRVKGFAKKYNTHELVYFEEFFSPLEAIENEKRIKNLKRHKKIKLIEKMNPEWKTFFP